MINDFVFTSNGVFDKSTKGKTIRVKGFSDEDILITKHMLLDEVRKQKAKTFR